MSEESSAREQRTVFSLKTAEIGVALLFLAVSAIVVWDSVRVGAKWAEDGPETGYFPFYIGLIIGFASLFNLLRAALIPAEKSAAFVEVGQFKLVLAVLVPTAIYTALIGWIGIYVASTVYVAFFMRWLGKYAWWSTAAVSIGNSVAFFLVFEIWFKIPLPKGPLEAALGLN
ncbi:MAG: tripartite tricarboxylate transporter TctB family protein [Betaproteobacteria bacterium]|nr:tripartite tricarboxylate transporter TctB family protein [Betaproteobacteria bacterium]